ncbi:MAG: hypothetical protein ACXWTP_10260 [Methylosarcina sp.]
MLHMTFKMPFFCLRFLHYCLGMLAGLFLAGGLAQAEIKGGDILITALVGGTDGHGALFVVNPKTGQRSILSDFGNPDQGRVGSSDLVGVAVGAERQIYVAEFFPGVLYKIDPNTGNRTVISEFSDTEGLWYGLAVDTKGRVIADRLRVEPPPINVGSVLVRINPNKDKRVVITDIFNPDQGETAEADDNGSGFITDFALGKSGNIFMGAVIFRNDLEQQSVIFRVDPTTGERKLLSDFTNPAQGIDVGGLYFVTGMAVDARGKILAASGGEVLAPRNLLFRIEPNTGQRTVLSDFDNSAQGTPGRFFKGVAVEDSGQILVVASKEGIDNPTLLFRVNPVTGHRIVLTDSENSAQGPLFSTLTSIAIVSKKKLKNN